MQCELLQKMLNSNLASFSEYFHSFSILFYRILYSIPKFPVEPDLNFVLQSVSGTASSTAAGTLSSTSTGLETIKLE